MNIEATKSELIQMIENVQNETVLERLNTYVRNITQVEKKDNPSVLTKIETELLRKINEGLPSEVWERFTILDEKQRGKGITAEEKEELFQLIDTMEIKDAERLEHLIKLADVWQMSVTEVMDKLGIKPPELIETL